MVMVCPMAPSGEASRKSLASDAESTTSPLPSMKRPEARSTVRIFSYEGSTPESWTLCPSTRPPVETLEEAALTEGSSATVSVSCGVRVLVETAPPSGPPSGPPPSEEPPGLTVMRLGPRSVI